MQVELLLSIMAALILVFSDPLYQFLFVLLFPAYQIWLLSSSLIFCLCGFMPLLIFPFFYFSGVSTRNLDKLVHLSIALTRSCFTVFYLDTHPCVLQLLNSVL